MIEEAKHEHAELEKAIKISMEAQKHAASEAERLRNEVRTESVKKPEAKLVAVGATKPDASKPTKAAVKKAPLPALTPSKVVQKTQPSKVVVQGKSQASDAAASWLSSAKAEASAANTTTTQVRYEQNLHNKKHNST